MEQKSLLMWDQNWKRFLDDCFIIWDRDFPIRKWWVKFPSHKNKIYNGDQWDTDRILGSFDKITGPFYQQWHIFQTNRHSSSMKPQILPHKVRIPVHLGSRIVGDQIPHTHTHMWKFQETRLPRYADRSGYLEIYCDRDQSQHIPESRVIFCVAILEKRSRMWQILNEQSLLISKRQTKIWTIRWLLQSLIPLMLSQWFLNADIDVPLA